MELVAGCLDISRRERRVFPRFFGFDPDGDDLSLAGGRKDGKKRDRGERGTRMTLNPTAVASPGTGVRSLGRERWERGLEIERRSKGGREETTATGEGRDRIYEEERNGREREGERDRGKEEDRDSAVEREYSSRDQYSRVLRSFILPRPSALSTHFSSFSFPFVHPLFPVALTLSSFFPFLLALSLTLSLSAASVCLSPLSSLSSCRDLHPSG